MEACLRPGKKQEPIFDDQYSFNVGYIGNLKSADYAIFIVGLLISALIGVYVAWSGRRGKSLIEFVLAGRSISAIPAGLSLTGSYVSGITMISVPGIIYSSTTMEVWFSLSVVFATYTATTLFMPVLFRLKLTSLYEYLELRFNRPVRLLGSAYFTLMTATYMALVLYAPSVAFNRVLGFSMWGSVLSVGFLCIFYTAMGGMRAVVYTDVFQVIMMFLGLVVLTVTSNLTVSWSDMYQSVVRAERLVLDDFRLDPTQQQTVWPIVAGGYFYTVASFGINQQCVHRFFCCKTESDAYRATWIACVVSIVIIDTAIVVGMFLSAFYENCDPASIGLVSSTDEYLPLFLMDITHGMSGIPGIYLAAVFSATLSSVSSGLNSIAVVALEDWFRPFFEKRMKSGFARFTLQLITIVIGLVALEMTAFVANNSDISVWQIDFALTGSLLAPLLGVVALGLVVPWANAKGALCGMIFASILNITMMIVKQGLKLKAQPSTVMCIGNCNISLLTNIEEYETKATTEPPPNYEFSLMDINSRYDIIFGVFVTMTTAIIVSYFTGFNGPNDVDPVLIVPFFDLHFPFYFLPESYREKLRFGIDHTDKWEKWQLKKDAEKEATEANKDQEKSDMDLIASSRDIFSADVARGLTQGRTSMQSSRESEV